MTQKASISLPSYAIGGLSFFPTTLDSSQTLYVVENRVVCNLSVSMNPLHTRIIVQNADNLPAAGIVKINSEYIYYDTLVGNELSGLIRGFANTDPADHAADSPVELVIMADHHNAVRDAAYNIQRKCGLRDSPANRDGNLSERVTHLRNKWWTPRALWFARPNTGPAPLTVQFMNFSRGFPEAFDWNFGDGTIINGGEEIKNPLHTYTKPGTYDVSLRVFTRYKGAATAYKTGQVTVLSESAISTVLVWTEVWSDKQNKFIQGIKGKAPLRIRMTDQTPGAIVKRVWSFDDGDTLHMNDPYEIQAEHVYMNPGLYRPTLLIYTGVDTQLFFRIPFTYEVLQ